MNDIIAQRVGAALRAARVARGVTQSDLACLLGVDRVTISRYEAGTRPMTVSTLVHLAAFLEVAPSDLLVGLPVGMQQETDQEQPVQATDMRWIMRTLLARPSCIGIVKAFLQMYGSADLNEEPGKQRG